MSPEVIATLEDLRFEFWREAFDQMLRSRVIIDGQYHRETDADAVRMYCGGLS